jgi:HSP20 family protein
MSRYYYKSILDELDDMRAYMDALFNRMGESGRVALLPPAGVAETKLLPLHRGGLRVDVAEHEDEITVTADLIPGITKKEVSLDLVNPQALEISCERKEEKKEEKEGYYMRERSFGSITRIVPLPKPVTDKGASATVKNGVLEVRLKKSSPEPKSKIPVE